MTYYAFVDLRRRSAIRVRLARDDCQSLRRYVERRHVRAAGIHARAAESFPVVERVRDAPVEQWPQIRLTLAWPALEKAVELDAAEVDEQPLPRHRAAIVR